MMRAIEIAGFGGPEVLRATQRPVPVPMAGELLIAVQASGINRPDVLQRKGLYPMPLEPPCTSSVSPACSLAIANTFCQTVKKVSGRLAASIMFRPGGTGRHWPTGATHCSA